MCLKRAFALLENRWKADDMDRSKATSGQGSIAFGKSLLPLDLFVSVMAFLDPHQAMQSGQTCKAWWRNGVLRIFYVTWCTYSTPSLPISVQE